MIAKVEKCFFADSTFANEANHQWFLSFFSFFFLKDPKLKVKPFKYLGLNSNNGRVTIKQLDRSHCITEAV